MRLPQRQFLRLSAPLLLAAAGVLDSAVATAPATLVEPGAAPAPRADAGLAAQLAAAGVRGTLLLHDPERGDVLAADPERAGRGFIPASTFKIPNSLIALETGVVADPDAVFRWDGVEREVAAWNSDQTLRQAIYRSTVWVYQDIARRIGTDRMRDWLARIGYGNQSIAGGIDRFWLDGELRITPREQLDFLLRLERGDLPFSPRTLITVREILERDRGTTPRPWVLRAKSGWSGEVGWWVGWLEREGHRPVFFVLEMDIERAADAPKRESVVRAVLRQRGYLPS